MARYLLFHNVMKTPFKYIVLITALTAALTLSAKATWVEENPPFGGVKLYFDVANHNVTDFMGFAGANNPSAPHVAIHTQGSVDTGSGWSNITPNTGNLTSLKFTPADDTLFSDFSFRGQLARDARGMVSVTIVDNLNVSTTINFSNLGHNRDFFRIGVVSTNGETIKSVTITSHFNEFKQVLISFGNGTVPDGGATVMLLGAALGSLGVARRFFKS